MARDTLEVAVDEPEVQPFEAAVNLRHIAQEIVLKTDGDRVKGGELLLETLRAKHPVFYALKTEQCITYWAQNIIKDSRSHLRSCIADAPRGPMSEPQQALSQGTLAAVANSWFDWPVASGVFMRDATRVHLLAATDKYKRDAVTYTKRGRWLAAIASKLPDDTTTVSTVLDEGALGEMAAKFGVSKS